MDKRVIAGIVLSWLVASAPPALAQSRPFRGLFGAQTAVVEPRQSLEFRTSLFGAYAKNPARFLAIRPPGGTKNPDFYYSDLNAGLWYTRRGEHFIFSASDASTVLQYPQVGNAIRWSQTGAVSITAASRRNTFGLQQQVDYTPYYRFRVVPTSSGSAASGLADVAPPDSAFAVTGRKTFRYDTGVDWTFRQSSRSTLSLGYRRKEINFVQATDQDWKLQDARISWNRSFTRTTALAMGYGFRQRSFQGQRQTLLRHDINIGMNYHNALAFSPRTTFNYSVGSEVISIPRNVQSVSKPTNFVRLIGHGDLTHQLSRTWRIDASYDRGTQYVEGISDVFFSDSATGSIVGYLGRRVDVQGTTDYTTGGLRLSNHQRGYNVQASTARVRIALSRSFAAQVDYLYYRFMFPDSVALPTGTPARDNRHVFRVGLTTWFPLLP